MREVASLCRGRELKKKLFVFTNRGVYDEANRKGYVRQIEDAGSKVHVDTCMVVAPLKEMGWKEIALNSFKGAQYSVNMGLRTKVDTAKNLIEEAL